VESSECPFEKFMGHLKAVEAMAKNDTNKIGVFRYIEGESSGDQWELMIKGKFILLNSCPNREEQRKGTSHKFSSFFCAF
jgi:hypothetical protein